MKIFSTLIFLFVLASTLSAQKAALPEILVPDAYLESEARRMGGDAFRILPRGMFKSASNSYDEKNEPLGIRGGGAYYSFTTGLHSYNKIPEFKYEDGQFQAGGFYGFNFGLMKDLGSVSLNDVSLENAEIVFLANYSYPRFVDDIYTEASKREYRGNGFVYRNRLPAIVGHTYILRAISFDEADIMVALTPVRKADDGKMDIVWKRLKTFETPRAWYSTDEQLSALLSRIMLKQPFAGLTADVKDNVVTFRGKASISAMIMLRSSLRPLRPAKIVEDVEIVER